MKRISLTSELDWDGTSEKSSDTVVTKQLQVVQELSVSALQSPSLQEEKKVDRNLNIKNVWEGLEGGAPPNRLLDSIPTSDLGESLDCRPRRVVEVDQGSRSAPVSANSLDSGDRWASFLGAVYLNLFSADTMSMRTNMRTSSRRTVLRVWWSK